MKDTKIVGSAIKPGIRFGALVVVELDRVCECHITKWWRVKCDCGTIFVTRARNLIHDKVKSCSGVSGSCPFNGNVKPREKIIIKGSIALIPLTRGKWAKIDKADLPEVRKLNWNFSSGGYAARHEGRDTVFLHNFLLPKKPGFTVDHINRDRLDNRRKNLRYATPTEQMLNQRVRSSSGLKGVSWNKTLKYWGASTKRNGKNIHLGWFKTKEAASEAYQKYWKNEGHIPVAK